MHADAQTLVPALVGLSVSEAAALAATAGVTVDPVTGPTTVGRVTGQQPLAGVRVEPGSAVQVTVTDTGGGGGGGARLIPEPVGPPDPSDAADPAAV